MRPIAIVAAAAALSVGGCGGNEGSTASKPAPAATATSTPTPSATTASGGDETTVKIVDFEYEPKTVSVTTGSRITWENEDAANHTVTFEKEPGDLGNVDPRKKLKSSFESAGRFAYVCQYHPSMKGTVVVQ